MIKDFIKNIKKLEKEDNFQRILLHMYMDYTYSRIDPKFKYLSSFQLKQTKKKLDKLGFKYSVVKQKLYQRTRYRMWTEIYYNLTVKF